MKLRCTPDDFHVEELTSVTPEGGPFAFYRLTKTSIGTPEAIHALTERWKIARHRISYGGLKDRHAVTIQHLTIHNGPRQSLRQKSINLEYLGQVSGPFTSAMISANRFGLVLRDMHADAVQRAQDAVRTVARTGLPNYFDDQRFGSLGNVRCGWRSQTRMQMIPLQSGGRNRFCETSGGNGPNVSRCWNGLIGVPSLPTSQTK